MITNEHAWLRRVITDPLDDASNHRRLEAALVGLLRVADYTRSLVQFNVSEVGRTRLAMRERDEWKRLYERTAEHANKLEDQLRELAVGAPEIARLVALEAECRRLGDRLTEALQWRERWHQRCLALESKLKLVEAGQA